MKYDGHTSLIVLHFSVCLLLKSEMSFSTQARWKSKRYTNKTICQLSHSLIH